jgi:hypothetical protein
MPTGDRNRHKICHCTANCNRLLGLSQRKHHYQLVEDPSTIRRSTTPPDHSASDNGEQSDILDDESGEQMDVDATDIRDGDFENDIEDVWGASGDNFGTPDNGQESGDGFYDQDDEEPLEFDLEDELDDPFQFLSLDEMREALEDELGPGMDQEMWELRELNAIN